MSPYLKSLVHTIANPLHLLVAAQTLFLILGTTILEFHVSWLQISLAVVAATVTEIALGYVRNRMFVSPMSAIAAALGIGIFFRSDTLWMFALAGVLAIASKYVIRQRGGHIFNPSNFAIVSLVFLTPQLATIEFTQWGDSIALFALIAGICFSIAYRAGVILTTVSFLVSYTLLLLPLLSFRPETFSAHHYGLIGPSLVLFASFMITDPRTSPQGTVPRILHGISVAATYFFFEAIGVRYALFVASFTVTIVNVLSRLIIERYSALVTSQSIPKNAVTAGLACSAFMIAATPLLVRELPRLSPLSLSPSFVFAGIESASFLQCRTPIYKTVASDIMPSAQGSFIGAAWGDFDSDGDDDLFVSDLYKPSKLYRNSDGAFRDVTNELSIPSVTSSSAFFADYDNDRRLDMFIFTAEYTSYRGDPESFTSFINPENTSRIRVFRNTGTSFSEVTHDLGLDTFELPKGTFATLSFADYDRDGDLDMTLSSRGRFFSQNGVAVEFGSKAIQKSLYDPFFTTTFSIVCNADDVRNTLRSEGTYSAELIEAYTAKAGCLFEQHSVPLVHTETDRRSGNAERVFNIPGSLHLFENTGDGFTEHAEFANQALSRIPQEQVSVKKFNHPFSPISGRFYQPVSLDFDGDGFQDIFVASDFGSNLLLKNNGDFSFTDVTTEANLDHSGSGMGVAVSDVNEDRKPDIFVTNVNEDYLFTSRDDGFDLDPTSFAPLSVGWGASFLDYDLDSFDDLLVANGDILATPSIAFGEVGRSFFRTDILYKKTSGAFIDASWKDLCPDSQSTMALAVSDYDSDGDPDFFAGNVPIQGQLGAYTLRENTTEGKKYLRIKLEGTTSNSYAIGAVVSVTAGGRTQTKYVLAGSSFYSQDSSTLVFGLDTHADPRIEIRWPSGKETIIERPEINSTVVVREP